MQSIIKEETPYFKFCQKLGGVQKKDVYVTPTKAATFLHLINNKCDKGSALHFAQRRICKWDTTTQFDGPHNCRILKPQTNREKKINGWQNIGFEMFYDNPGTIADLKQLELDPDNDLIQQEIEKNEMKLKNDFKNKIKHLQQFYNELNEKYSFNSKDPEFKEKIKQTKIDLLTKKNKPVPYLKDKGMKYIELYEELKHSQSQKKDCLLNRLHVFNQLKTEHMKIKEKPLSNLYKTKKLETSPKSNQLELQHDLHIYDKIQLQSQAMLDIMDSNAEFGVKMKIHPNQHQAGTQRAIAFAEDFNNTKYLFQVKQQKMFEISEQPTLQLPSSKSINLRKNISTPKNYEDYFDTYLKKYSHEVLTHQQEIGDSKISTGNLEKMIFEREQLRTSQFRRISKTTHIQHCHSHQPSLEYSRAKQNSSDKDSTKAGNSFHQKQRSFMPSPFSK